MSAYKITRNISLKIKKTQKMKKYLKLFIRNKQDYTSNVINWTDLNRHTRKYIMVKRLVKETLNKYNGHIHCGTYHSPVATRNCWYKCDLAQLVSYIRVWVPGELITRALTLTSSELRQYCGEGSRGRLYLPNRPSTQYPGWSWDKQG